MKSSLDVAFGALELSFIYIERLKRMELIAGTTDSFHNSLDKICAALSKAQGQMRAVHKSKNNPHFKSKYASLDDIIEMARPILAENGLSVIQIPSMDGQNCGVHTKLYHSSGQFIDCGLIMLPIGRGGGAQGAGSSITYARRYAFSAVLSISCDEDDDGNAAQKSKPKAEPKKVLATKEQTSGFIAKCAEEEINVPEEILNQIEEGKIIATELKEVYFSLKAAKEAE